MSQITDHLLLPWLSKVIENVIHEQTIEFLNDNTIFYKNEYGFRSNHSTDLRLSFLKDYTGIILIVLQKPFVKIKNKILLHKLFPIGFSKNTISWYESYLAERHFTVEVPNRFSLMFLIYVNDLSQAVESNLYL